MDIRKITDRYAVSPQILIEDFPAIAQAGFTTVIANRPDEEVPSPQHCVEMAQAAKSAGLAFHVLPLTHQTFTPTNISTQRDIVAQADGPVLAYCASGTRCTIAWAFGEVGTRSIEDILAKAQAAGYDLAGMRPTLLEMEQNGGS